MSLVVFFSEFQKCNATDTKSESLSVSHEPAAAVSTSDMAVSCWWKEVVMPVCLLQMIVSRIGGGEAETPRQQLTALPSAHFSVDSLQHSMLRQLSRAPRAALSSLRAGTTDAARAVPLLASTSTSSAAPAAQSRSATSTSLALSRTLSTTRTPRRETSAAAPSPSAEPHIPSASASEKLLQVTTLPNGVRVATDGTPGHFVAAGVYVGAGSRFEWEGNSGSSHMIDRLAYKVRANVIKLDYSKLTPATSLQRIGRASR